jgi:HEAT repeat protein
VWNESKEQRRLIFVAKRDGDVEYLIAALAHGEFGFLAARFLADLGATEAAAALERLSRTRDPTSRRAAVRALGRLEAVSSLPRLREVAREDNDPVIRAWAIAGIAEIGGDGAMGDIAEDLTDPVWVVRRGAVYALGVLGDANALPALTAAKRTESWRRRKVYRNALRRIRYRNRRDLKHGWRRSAAP